MVIDSPQTLIIFIDVLPQPWALYKSKAFIISNISSSVTWNKVIQTFVLFEKSGKILAFCIDLYVDEKKY